MSINSQTRSPIGRLIRETIAQFLSWPQVSIPLWIAVGVIPVVMNNHVLGLSSSSHGVPGAISIVTWWVLPLLYPLVPVLYLRERLKGPEIQSLGGIVHGLGDSIGRYLLAGLMLILRLTLVGLVAVMLGELVGLGIKAIGIKLPPKAVPNLTGYLVALLWMASTFPVLRRGIWAVYMAVLYKLKTRDAFIESRIFSQENQKETDLIVAFGLILPILLVMGTGMVVPKPSVAFVVVRSGLIALIQFLFGIFAPLYLFNKIPAEADFKE